MRHNQHIARILLLEGEKYQGKMIYFFPSVHLLLKKLFYAYAEGVSQRAKDAERVRDFMQDPTLDMGILYAFAPAFVPKMSMASHVVEIGAKEIQQALSLRMRCSISLQFSEDRGMAR